MGFPLGQLLQVPTLAATRARLLQALQGIGYVRRTVGVSLGSVELEGLPAAAYACQLKVATSGTPTGCTVQVSTDGGVTFAAAVTPTTDGFDGLVTVGATGITARLKASVTGSPSSRDFIVGSVFAFDLAVSVLPVTAWQEGSTPLTLVEVFSQALTDEAASIYGIAAGSLIPCTYGAWLDLLAQGVYGLTRRAAQTAQHRVRVDVGVGAGPYVMPAGQLIAATVDELLFSNTTQATLASGASTIVTLQAESAGAAYNVGIGSISLLVTSLAGARCVNVAVPGQVTSIIVAGSDAESDAELQQRCLNRWPSLGIGGTAASYDLLAREASDEVTRVVVSADTVVPGQVNVLLAGAAGAVSGAAVTAVEDYLESRVPLCVVASVASAADQAVAVTATVYVASANLTSAQTEGLAALRALINGTPIAGTVYLTQIIDALQRPSGVRNLTISTPSADVSLASNKVATVGVLTITYVGV